LELEELPTISLEEDEEEKELDLDSPIHVRLEEYKEPRSTTSGYFDA
jgi:hypothetical protein